MTPTTKAKKSSDMKQKIPPPGTESRAIFSASLAIAKELLNLDGLRTNLDENGNVDLIIDAEKLKAIDKDKFKEGLTPEHFLALVTTEFESLVKVATYSDPTQGIQNEIPSKILKEVGKDEFLWRFQQVKKELVPPNLKERVMFRQTAQGFVLQNVSWQVITKKYDQDRGKLSDIPCGSLSIIYASPKSNRPSVRLSAANVSIELPTTREPKQLMLELHQSDVEEMIQTLTNLRDNLEKVNKSK
jgi:hypothetical protein